MKMNASSESGDYRTYSNWNNLLGKQICVQLSVKTADERSILRFLAGSYCTVKWVQIDRLSGYFTSENRQNEDSRPSLRVMLLAPPSEMGHFTRFLESCISLYNQYHLYDPEPSASYLADAGGKACSREDADGSHVPFPYVPPLRHSPPVILSQREQEVLEGIVMGYTTTVISQKLKVAPNTIKTYRKRLLRKFNVNNSSGLVREAIRKRFVKI